ncbi:MAG: hypothetical protein A3J37_04085 [Alphaproteobacteria bacterium RIFCSPHIGHO2_12_FULL_45_9]|nr:MAG: hypothetical protein A3J37_04085 [Alphaproteobacteria bacterium RIFCSPHIGHO2_12_FULL_45_9]
MATIRKRAGKYQVQIRRKGSATISKTCATRNEAETWARLMETKAYTGDLPVSLRLLDEYTVAHMLIKYRDEVTIKKLSANSEFYIINAFLKTSIAALALSNVTAGHFSSYRETRLKTVKAGTVNREFQIIRHAFDMAQSEWNIPIKFNPILKIKKLKVKDARTRRLYSFEYELLISNMGIMRNTFMRPIIDLALETAMRRGEILALKWRDINWNKRTLHIPISKNGHSRTIPLSTYALEILKLIEKDCAGDKVFNTTASAVQQSWQRLVKRCGITDLHFHDLRHEAISRLFEKGLSIAEVALISGHRDFKMLFRYTHLKAEDIVKKI